MTGKMGKHLGQSRLHVGVKPPVMVMQLRLSFNCNQIEDCVLKSAKEILSIVLHRFGVQ